MKIIVSKFCIFNSSFIKYLLVGILNTIVGFGSIFILMFAGVGAYISNMLGYAFGIVFSYFMNKNFTFKSKNKSNIHFIKFVLAMLIAYGLNLLSLYLALNLIINPYIAQCLAGVVYTISGYLLSRFFVFKRLSKKIAFMFN